MKPQELNQDEQKNTNGGFLTDSLLGGGNSNNNNSGSHSGSGSSSGSGNSGSNGNDDDNNSSSGLLGGLPLIGDIL